MSVHRLDLIEHSVEESSTVPNDYEDLLAYYTKRGYRVIALAGKSVEGLTWLKAQKLKRYVSRSDESAC